jgi:hypothetical protein
MYPRLDLETFNHRGNVPCPEQVPGTFGATAPFTLGSAFFLLTDAVWESMKNGVRYAASANHFAVAAYAGDLWVIHRKRRVSWHE